MPRFHSGRECSQRIVLFDVDPRSQVQGNDCAEPVGSGRLWQLQCQGHLRAGSRCLSSFGSLDVLILNEEMFRKEKQDEKQSRVFRL